MDHAAAVGVEIDAIGAVREGLHAVAQNAFFGIVHFIDIALAKTAHLHRRDIADVEIAVQGRGGLEFTVGFQLDFTGLAQLKAGIEGELVRPELHGFSAVLERKGQHYAAVVFVMTFQGPWQIAGKAVRRQTLLRRRTKPGPANRHAAAQGDALFKRGVVAQPQNFFFTGGFPGEQAAPPAAPQRLSPADGR